ncbi:MAG: hypothetical protein MK110_14000 [Fuerstiella sp.]|nr:hypothetical protein [Fuerstiella sp.]
MKLNENMMQRQLEILTRAVSVCETARTDLAELQTQLSGFEGIRKQRLHEIRQQETAQLRQETRNLQIWAEQQRKTLQLDRHSQAESFRAQQTQTSEIQISEITEQLLRLAEQEQNELWVLQSVLDDVTDSPIDRLERDKDTFHSRKRAMEQRFDVLEKQINRTHQFLAECRTSVQIETPSPESFSTDDASLSDVIRKSGDELLAEAGRLESKPLPRWICGKHLWFLSLVPALLVFVPVLLIKVQPGSLLNPDLASPDWQWMLIAGLCGCAAASFVSVTCLTIVQNQLRAGFGRMLQNFSNARSLRGQWKQRSQQRLLRMEDVADKWTKNIAQQRKQKTAVIRQRTATQRTILEEKIERIRNDLQLATEDHSERLQQHTIAELQRIDEQQSSKQQRIAQQTSLRITERQTVCNSELDGETQKTRATADRLTEQWNQQLSTVRQLTQESMQTGLRGHRWPSLHDTEWNAPEQMPSAMSPGDLLVTLPKAPESAAQPSTTNLCMEMPAILTFPDDSSILVKHDSAGREAALSFLRTQILRLLTLIPPGRIRLTLIDPVGLGQSFSAMMHLTDYDDLLIHSRIRTDESQIRSQLRKTTEHMENVFQTYLRSEFSTIEEYNKSADEVAEPYHFVVVADFPQAFSEESVRHLSSILTSGPSCGVYTMIAWNPSLAGPTGIDMEDMLGNLAAFRVRNQTVVPTRELPESLLFEPVPEPTATDFVNIVKAVGEKSKNARRVEVSFRRIAPRQDAIWKQSTAESIDLPIGRAGAARLQYMRLGRGTSQHVLVAGKTGSGKSTFLHIVITNLALHYSPAEIRFYLIDFKKGVEFRTYAANRLPHARVVAIESDREFGLSVLERLDVILQERGDLFRSRGIQDLPSFRKEYPGETMPRLLLLIDEFQEFFVAEDRIASRASLLLDRLIRQGRAFGIHVMLGSQTLGGAYSLARSTMGQVAVRVALQCSDSDAHLILSDENAAARLLTRPGEAIYNDANGLKEGNHPFQIAWLEEEIREDMIRQLNNRSDLPDGESSMIVFDGNVTPTVEQCGPLQATFSTVSDATRQSIDTRPLWLGEPVAISAPTHIELRRSAGQNLLLVGQDELLIDRILGLIALSACAEADTKANVTVLHSSRHEESTERFKQLAASGAAPGIKLHTADACVDVIQASVRELQRREQLADHAQTADVLLIIRDIGQFRELKREDDNFGLGNFGEPKTETPSSMFTDLIRRGPLVGIHVVVWADTFNNAMRWLTSSLLREFENRIILRMNQTDSASLVDSPVAASLGPGRALLYQDQTGTVEKFRPFAWPTESWLTQVVNRRSRDCGSGMDIESLKIE